MPGFGFKGLSFRVLDPSTQEWSIYWVNSRNGKLALPPVVIYKSSRVFNFAAGEFVTLGAFGTYVGSSVIKLPYPLAMVVGVLFGTAAGLATERLVVRPLNDRPKVTVLVATAAIAIVLIPFELMIGKVKPFPARPAIHGVGVKILGVYVSPQQMLIMLALALSAIGLAWFFGRTDLGLATLATSQEPTASRLVGIRLNRISLLTWGTAGFLGGLAGVLLPPVTSNFTAGFGTTSVLISAFTAAVLGRDRRWARSGDGPVQREQAAGPARPSGAQQRGHPRRPRRRTARAPHRHPREGGVGGDHARAPGGAACGARGHRPGTAAVARGLGGTRRRGRGAGPDLAALRVLQQGVPQ